ncbi:tRNA (adenosine(37)-N6)-threonylcarbamoyltransferase complex dimerization subunit type 1 TsaB [Tepidicella baoligensis]|uniref:tRNA (adenosine(37)-N6)-threonylcarbamoyltransferase complex dimerization subunit type 1 TsaB n=1 Tax=Tepidicella baoligensis TaxID=2707016 RepID=UPI0015DB297D|nr:tRNA (adenosine(37)-N6)-threonylcarbamoyltransferase complex dimerization subunit type 1 TsaB [Tepidicella baoligensis]
MTLPTSTLPQKVLALDTSTERMSIALGAAGQPPLALHEAEGGARASATLLPTVRRLLAALGWRLAELDAIAFGCGPGAFTGLRTACAVVQGLAVAGRPGGIPVIPVHTLLAVAQAALTQWQQTKGPWPGGFITIALDARMDEMYVADVAVEPMAGGDDSCALKLIRPAALYAPEALATGEGWPMGGGSPPVCLAGNAAPLYAERWPTGWRGVPQILAWPTAAAVLRLSGALWAEGAAVQAADAQPLYVRDKVAQTTQERERLQALKTRDPATGTHAP